MHDCDLDTTQFIESGEFARNIAVNSMQILVRRYGHLVLFGTKGHPEMNVAGQEYDWGASKKHF